MSDSNEKKAGESGGSFEIKTVAASDQFKAKCSNVFNFDEVKIKSSGDSKNDPDHQSASKVDVDEFKGRESLYRVPDNEWDRPRDRSRSKRHRHRNDEHDDRSDDSRSKSESPQSSDLRARLNRLKDDRTFKRPPMPPRGGHRGGGQRGRKHVPGYWKNPEKYTKYSLEDVDMTNNRGNSQAAFSFLADLRKRKEGDEEEDKFDGATKVQFKRPTKKRSSDAEPESSSAPASKNILPEYVVGQKPKKDRKSKSEPEEEQKNKSSKKQMTLSHLMDEEEEEEEED